ncbi:MAG: cytochrome-c peroxidase [Sediminibacterium sp.]
MKPFRIVFLLFIAMITMACSKQITQLFEGFKKPSNFPDPVYKFENNQITQAGFELGRSLFFDPILSADNSISCGSCHIPTSAFTQHGHSVSHGINDLLGTRNSPPIMNLAWNNSFMWDGGIVDLDLQPIAPITSHIEMGESMSNVLKKLNQNSKYKVAFKKAFGTEDVTNIKMLKALSQFMLMCVSAESKYDSVMRNQQIFTESENLGYQIFKKNCNNCHREPLFTDNSFRNNGLPPSSLDDIGRALITLKEGDKYKFKVPSLRNLMYTAPYMHDGRFLNLDAVLDHYINKIADLPNLDSNLKSIGKSGIILSNDEKANLLAFLQTLNDKKFVSNTLIGEQ